MSDQTPKRNGTLKWIIALCLTATLAIIGWTITGTLATRLKILENIQVSYSVLNANLMANNIRISVLENKYDTIQAALAEIKAILTKRAEP